MIIHEFPTTSGLKMLAFAFFMLTVFGCHPSRPTTLELQANTPVHYRLAMDFLTNHDSIKLPEKYVVSEEAVDIRNYLDIYADSVKDYIRIGDKNMITFNVVKERNEALKLMSSGKSKRNIIFFSELSEDLFFVEIFEGLRTKVETYLDLPVFGSSSVHIFHYDDDIASLQLLHTGVLSYN